MNLLVTGGAGFIGSHLVDALIVAGHTVSIIDNLSTGKRENINKNAKLYEINITTDEVESVFRDQSFDVVYHLAAQIDVRVSVSNPVADVMTNIAGSVRLLECARIHHVKRFVFASTGGAIYGEQDHFPADEQHPTRPLSPYGVAKLAVERYMYYFHKEYGLDCIALRYANVYGPRQNPHGEAGVIAIFSRRLFDGVQTLINGDGLQTRDYTYVGDIIDANLRVIDLKGFHYINIGTGVETDVITLFDEINKLSSANVNRQFKDAAPGEQRRSCIDPTLAGELLGWYPKVVLRDGLKNTVEYFRHQQP